MLAGLLDDILAQTHAAPMPPDFDAGILADGIELASNDAGLVIVNAIDDLDIVDLAVRIEKTELINAHIIISLDGRTAPVPFRQPAPPSCQSLILGRAKASLSLLASRWSG